MQPIIHNLHYVIEGMMMELNYTIASLWYCNNKDMAAVCWLFIIIIN